MRHRAFSALGALLVIAGVAILAYVGISYWQQRTATGKGWTSTQLRKAQRIALHVKAPKGVKLGTDPAQRIVIPAIDVNSPVVQTPPRAGVWTVADWAVGHLTTSPNPGAAGNGAYAAHDDIKGEIFKRIAELKPGAAIKLVTKKATYTYVVTKQLTVSPSDTAVLASSRVPTVTLVSCVPYWVDTERIIVQGTLKSVSQA